MGQFDGKVALVTGGNSGIGRATSIAFAKEGAKVVIAARREREGLDTVKNIESAGGEAMFVKTDVSKASDIEAAVRETVHHYGRLDYAFNNAGVGGGTGPLHEVSEEVWDRIINVNLKGVWLCMKSEIAQMLKQGSGAIVNDSSVGGLVGSDWIPIYSASKHGVVGLTKSAALQYAQQGIRINAICPGWTYTPMVENAMNNVPDLEQRILASEPVGRMGTPEEVAEAVIWLCSDSSSFVTGHAMAIDGGYTAQ